MLKDTIKLDLIRDLQFRSFEKYEDEIVCTNDFDMVNRIISIEKLVRWVIQSKGVLFTIKESSSGRKVLDEDKCRVLNRLKPYLDYDRKRLMDDKTITSALIERISESLPMHIFNPYVMLYIRNLHEILISNADTYQYVYEYFYIHYSTDESLEIIVDLLNQFIESIRSEGRSKPFITIVDNYKRLQSKNYKSLVSYFNNLFRLYARLLVIRIDLSYAKDDYILTEDEMTARYFQVKQSRAQLFRDLKSKRLFKHELVGHAYKIEYGLMKGYHVHCVLFFDGSQARQDINIAMVIGEHWKHIMGGNGLYFNCNQKKQEYENQGIGIINYYDTELREGFVKMVAGYLTKTDYYARMIAPGKGRTFCRGEIKSEPSKRGRPREYGYSAH